jgi:hypothetical protein
LRTAAERDRDGRKLVSVALLGRPEQFKFGGSFTARDESNVTTGDLDAVGGRSGSVQGTVRGELTGTIESNVENGQFQGHVDVVDRDGNPVDPGMEGRIVVTDFHNAGRPSGCSSRPRSAARSAAESSRTSS